MKKPDRKEFACKQRRGIQKNEMSAAQLMASAAPSTSVGSASGSGSATAKAGSIGIASGVGSAQAAPQVIVMAEFKDQDAFPSPEVVRRLAEHPVEIRDAARVLSQEFRHQIQELKRVKPNGADRLAEHQKLVVVSEQMAAGLSELDQTLDLAITNATDGQPEPIFLGKAGRIVEQLHLCVMEWLAENRTMVIEFPVRLTALVMGVAFLHSLGADSVAAITALTAVVLKGGQKTSKKGPRVHRRRHQRP